MAAATLSGATRRPAARKLFPDTTRSRKPWHVPSAAIFPCRLRPAAKVGRMPFRIAAGRAVVSDPARRAWGRHAASQASGRRALHKLALIGLDPTRGKHALGLFERDLVVKDLQPDVMLKPERHPLFIQSSVIESRAINGPVRWRRPPADTKRFPHRSTRRAATRHNGATPDTALPPNSAPRPLADRA